MSNLSMNWFNGLNSKEKEDTERLILNNNDNPVLRRLLKVIGNKQNEFNNIERTADFYDSPSWAYREADIIGQRKAFKYVEDLLKFVDQKGR